VAKRTAARIERKLTASISAAATVEQKPAAPSLAANGGGGGGTRVMIIGKLRGFSNPCCHAKTFHPESSSTVVMNMQPLCFCCFSTAVG
jgi:hypothetical protein